jgi:hypothetical protein
VGQGGEMNQALYAHMNNKRKKKNQVKDVSPSGELNILDCRLMTRIF